MADREGNEFLPEITLVRVGRLTIYQITETELLLLERGSADSLFLTFAIALLSTAASLLVTLLTTPIESTRLFIVFVLVVIVGSVSGFVLLALWRWHHVTRSKIIRDIRDRALPEGGNVALPIAAVRSDGPA